MKAFTSFNVLTRRGDEKVFNGDLGYVTSPLCRLSPTVDTYPYEVAGIPHSKAIPGGCSVLPVKGTLLNFSPLPHSDETWLG